MSPQKGVLLPHNFRVNNELTKVVPSLLLQTKERERERERKRERERGGREGASTLPTSNDKVWLPHVKSLKNRLSIYLIISTEHNTGAMCSPDVSMLSDTSSPGGGETLMVTITEIITLFTHSCVCVLCVPIYISRISTHM